MTLTLDPAIELRIQRHLDEGRFCDPSEFIAHALDLVEAEQTGDRVDDRAMEDWLLRNKEAINRGLDESFAVKERGESYSPEEAWAILEARRGGGYTAFRYLVL
jgi:Arc/MetJ-type ribon-helix-helix transcriptional regulator